MVKHEPIVGRYVEVEHAGETCRIFYEEAGAGLPLLCMHTAGTDSRQWRHILNDAQITKHFRVIAFDLPYLGRSTPTEGWWLKIYKLSTNAYAGIIRAVWRAL